MYHTFYIFFYAFYFVYVFQALHICCIILIEWTFRSMVLNAMHSGLYGIAAARESYSQWQHNQKVSDSTKRESDTDWSSGQLGPCQQTLYTTEPICVAELSLFWTSFYKSQKNLLRTLQFREKKSWIWPRKIIFRVLATKVQKWWCP